MSAHLPSSADWQEIKALDTTTLTRRADEGDIWCQFHLGGRFIHGDRTEPDQEKAFAYYLKAACGGIGEAQHLVAVFIGGGYVDGYSEADAAAWDFIAVLNHTEGAGDIFTARCKDEAAINACRTRAKELLAAYPGAIPPDEG